jgi:hypothetical protein
MITAAPADLIFSARVHAEGAAPDKPEPLFTESVVEIMTLPRLFLLG